MDLAFLRNQWTPLPYPTHDFSGKTVIVTGSNIGLGHEAARHFARLGAAKVILAVRSISKGEEAAASIHASTSTSCCEVWQVDMGNFDSVKAFCKRAAGLDRIDVVCENAGIAVSEYQQSDGFESTVAVNVVGTFLMAINLLPVLRASAEKTGNVPRLVIVSSEVHAYKTNLPERSEPSIFDALNKNDPSYMAHRYPTSKLLEVLFVRALATAMQKGPHASQPVVLNMLNPGLCHSGLARNIKGVGGMIFYVMKLILARTTEVGSRTLVASAAAGQESHGKYMSNCEVTEPSEFVRSEEGAKTQERVWTELMAILEGIQPGISKLI